MDATDLSTIIKAQEAFSPKVLSLPGVFATGIGRKRVAGAKSDVMSIRIHVVKKRPLHELPMNERIPSTIDGFPTDVVEGRPPVLCSDEGKYRPLKGGIEIGVRFKYGTAGCMVKARTADKNGHKLTYALSCAHVLDEKDTRTFQPATFVVGDRIGNTQKSTINTRVDCAITDLTYYDDGGVGVIAGIGRVRGSREDIHDGLRVLKRGRTTLLTVGTVEDVNLIVKYPNGGPLMTGQILIDYNEGNFAESGDSGSVVVDFDNKVIGLLWGVSSDGRSNRGIANPIKAVLDELDVDLVTTASDVVRPRRATPLERIAPLFHQSVRGQQLWQTFVQGEWNLGRLMQRSPQLYAMWLTLPQEELQNALFEGAADVNSAIPAKVGPLDTVELLGLVRNNLSRYVESDSARGQLDSLYLDLTQNIGKSWRAALGDGDAEVAPRPLAGGNGGPAIRPVLAVEPGTSA